MVRRQTALGALLMVSSALLLASCGDNGPANKGASPGTSTPCRSGRVTVAAELGTTPHPLCVVRSARLDIILQPPGGGGLVWGQPVSSDIRILRPLGAARTSDGGWTASFAAAAGGHARITAPTTAPCTTAQPACRVASFLWDLPVSVTPNE